MRNKTKAATLRLQRFYNPYKEYYLSMGLLLVGLVILSIGRDAEAASSNITTIDGLTTNLNTWLGGPLKKTAMYILGIGTSVVGALKSSWVQVVIGMVIVIFNIVLQNYINGL